MPFHSHYVLASKIMRELVKCGHEVTVINPYPQKNPIPNYKDISVESLIGIMNGMYVVKIILVYFSLILERKKHLYGLEEQTVLGNVHFMTKMGCILTENTLKNQNVQNLLKSNETFDLVVMAQFLNEGLMGIAHHFKAPVVLLSTMPLLSWANFLIGHPAPSSYVPNSLSKFTGKMNFWQRVTNSFYDTYAILYHQWLILPKHREYVKKYVPGEPELYDFVANVSFIFIHAHHSVYDAFPLVPNAINIGGLHVDPPKQLPQDLQTYLDEAEEGVIIFSMGSNLRSCDLSVSKREALLKTFSKVKQKVLWKWESEEVPNLPQNVKIMQWLPQSDVLGLLLNY